VKEIPTAGKLYITMLTKVVGTAAFIPATLAFLTRRYVPLPVTLILAHFAAAGFAVALAASDRYAGSSTSILGKKPSGVVAWWGWGLFWPYHLALQTKLWIQRQYSVEPVWNQIADGWCVHRSCETLSRHLVLLYPTPSRRGHLHLQVFAGLSQLCTLSFFNARPMH